MTIIWQHITDPELMIRDRVFPDGLSIAQYGSARGRFIFTRFSPISIRNVTAYYSDDDIAAVNLNNCENVLCNGITAMERA